MTDFHWFELGEGCPTCGSERCAVCGSNRADTIHFVGGKTREEWEPIGRASAKGTEHLPED